MYSFIVLPALALYLFLAWKAMGAAYRSTSNPILKFIFPSIALVALVLLPFADVAYSRIRMSHLCKTEPQLELLGKISLPAAFFPQDGSISTIVNSSGGVDWNHLKTFIRREYEVGYDLGVPSVERVVEKLVDVNSKKIVARQINLIYRGSWLRFSGIGFGAIECYPEKRLHQVLHLIVVKE